MNPHTPRAAGIVEMFASFWRNRQLILQMTKREVIGRYRGSVVGIAWSFFNPLLMLAVYTFVFSTVFKARWGGGEETRAEFAIILFVGIIIHGLLAECVNKAPSLVLNNASYVKRVVFPLEVLPWATMGSAIFHLAISLAVMFLAQWVMGHSIPWTVVLFPVVLLPLALLTMGLIWLISSTSVFVRDIAQVTGIATTALMFLAPVFYPLSALPEQFRVWMSLNPLTLIIEQSRAVLIAGQVPDWGSLAIYFVVALAVACMGFWWFQRTRRGFADVI